MAGMVRSSAPPVPGGGQAKPGQMPVPRVVDQESSQNRRMK